MSLEIIKSFRSSIGQAHVIKVDEYTPPEVHRDDEPAWQIRLTPEIEPAGIHLPVRDLMFDGEPVGAEWREAGYRSVDDLISIEVIWGPGPDFYIRMDVTDTMQNDPFALINTHFGPTEQDAEEWVVVEHKIGPGVFGRTIVSGYSQSEATTMAQDRYDDEVHHVTTRTVPTYPPHGDPSFKEL